MAYSDGFDFMLSVDGELQTDADTLEAGLVYNNDQKIQMAVDRIKSVSHNWYYDYIGADLEILVGRPCSPETVMAGKNLIEEVLTIDKLFLTNTIRIFAEIKDRHNIFYEVYLRLEQTATEEAQFKKIELSLDLVKGVSIHYGWKQRVSE